MTNDDQSTRQATDKLSGTGLHDMAFLEPEVDYRPVPQPNVVAGASQVPVWRVRFDLATDPSKRFGLDINGEVILGRGGETPEMVDLNPYEAGELGVSRRHLALRPTTTALYVIDLGSTNGTLRNGRSIGINTPYPLVNGDTLTLGRLQFVIRIIERPILQTAPLERKLELADALQQIARSITSQLDLDEVLNQVAETAMTLTSAGEAGIWLVDERTGELFLEAQRGIEDEKIRRMRLPIREDTLAGKVINTGKPLRASRQPGEEAIKVKTDYLVEALVYVPIALGGVTFGVLAVAHREPGKRFRERDERLLLAIADFAAIAIQNARLYQATDQALARRVKELSALNELSHTVSSSLDLERVYRVLVEQMSKHWPVAAVRLYLLDKTGESLYVYTSATEPDGNVSVPVGKGILGSVAQSGEVIVTNDAHSHPCYNPLYDQLGNQAPQSMACVPLRIQERIVGVLSLFNKTDGPFSDDDVSRLQLFANPVATAIQNARLFAESERQRAAIQITAQALSQPLLILDDDGEILISNAAAREIVSAHMATLFDGLSSGVGRTTELQIGNRTYLTTTEHSPEVGTIVVMQDITYVKKLERDRLEFTHTLSHDLKSPLTSIRGWAQLLQKVVPLDERSTRYIQQIVAASDRLLSMINQLLESAESEASPMEFKPCDLAAVISRTINHVEGAALTKDIRISFEQTGKPYSITGDETRLYHMVLNLLDNAIKYSPQSTQVGVKLDFGDSAITLQVWDEGPGIAPEDMPHIFEKYYRGRGAATTSAGTGVGLSSVLVVAEAHHGKVTVRNRPERGAEFTVTLPASLRAS